APGRTGSQLRARPALARDAGLRRRAREVPRRAPGRRGVGEGAALRQQGRLAPRYQTLPRSAPPLPKRVGRGEAFHAGLTRARAESEPRAWRGRFTNPVEVRNSGHSPLGLGWSRSFGLALGVCLGALGAFAWLGVSGRHGRGGRRGGGRRGGR